MNCQTERCLQADSTTDNEAEVHEIYWDIRLIKLFMIMNGAPDNLLFPPSTTEAPVDLMNIK